MRRGGHPEGVKSVRCVVTGRVQGVGFRRFVEREALALGLAGHVCNRPDGSVEAVAEGAESRLIEFVGSLRRGPIRARVDSVDVDWQDGAPRYRSFRIT